MECKKEKNMANCNCSYEPCSRKGVCCECVTYHRNMRQIPACFFPDDVEKTYDRSYEKFIETYK
ncbi:MAG: DUF6485 family protein [Nitrospinota bacterium]|nr:hypothetical protein [Nitrospinota bacterium]